MPNLRPALIEILSRKRDPWDTVLQWCTLNPLVLSHSSVIVVVMNTITGAAHGRQIVYSSEWSRPWGLVAKCGRSGCQSRPGDVYAERNRRGSEQHKHFIFTCKVCKYATKVTRPSWITPAHKDRPYYFVTPWPLTDEQVKSALGLNVRWEPNTNPKIYDVEG